MTRKSSRSLRSLRKLRKLRNGRGKRHSRRLRKMRKFVRIGGGQIEVKSFDRFRDLKKYMTENPNKKLIDTKAYELIGWVGLSDAANNAIAEKYKETHGDDVTIVPDGKNNRIRVPMTPNKNRDGDYHLEPSTLSVFMEIMYMQRLVTGYESSLRSESEYICTFEDNVKDKVEFNVERPVDEYEKYINGYGYNP
jgi:hypothetical protein